MSIPLLVIVLPLVPGLLSLGVALWSAKVLGKGAWVCFVGALLLIALLSTYVSVGEWAPRAIRLDLHFPADAAYGEYGLNTVGVFLASCPFEPATLACVHRFAACNLILVGGALVCVLLRRAEIERIRREHVTVSLLVDIAALSLVAGVVATGAYPTVVHTLIGWSLRLSGAN